MTQSQISGHKARGTLRRRLVACSAGIAITASSLGATGIALAQDDAVDITQWTPEYIASIAGTETVNTEEECYATIPADYDGNLTFWFVGPNEASPERDHVLWADFFEAFGAAYPNIELETQNLDYNQMLDKARTASLGRAAPMAARFPILWGVEFAAKGFLQEFGPDDLGYSTNQYWPGAMKSVTWQGDIYGVPTNNETMALIWNANLFEEAGLDPDTGPATWDELVEFSKQIKDNTGKDGYGLVARVNAGNTPFRFMPQMWAYGGGALDEAEDVPTYEQIYINNEGSKAALQASYDMYVRDKSVPTSALTNTQTQNQDPFIAGQLAMVISHPSEYAVMLDRAAKATGADKEIADKVVDGMRYGLIPSGPVRRSVVFGGSNLHLFNETFVDGGVVDRDAARAFGCFIAGPEWSTKLNWTSSNPGNIRGFKTEWMKQRLEETRFLDVSTSMLAHGVPFPIIPETAEIMNIIIPEMLQNALTGKMTVDEAADDAARKVDEVLNGF